MVVLYRSWLIATWLGLTAQIANAQTIPRPNIPPIVPPPSTEPLPETPTPTPSPEQLLPFPTFPVIPEVPSSSETITVTEFIFTGNTIFNSQELAEKTTTGLLDRSLPISRLLQIASDVAKLYAERGYSTSGAVIVIPQVTQQQGRGVVEVQVIEGTLEKIVVIPGKGAGRLNPEYVRSRLALASGTPLNINRLQEALQLLQIDPLITQISAQLSDGSRQGTTILTVQYTVAQTFHIQTFLDNDQVDSVGSFRRGIEISEASLLGYGDALQANYRNTDGSNDLEAAYTFPINPRNGTVRFHYRATNSRIITEPFDRFNIKSDFQQYDLTLRQPIVQTPRQEFVIGITFDRQETNNSILGDAVPLSPGADIKGRTRISPVRLFQEWLERDGQQVIAARSSFSISTGLFGTTEAFDIGVNPDAPNRDYFLWRGQAQWARLLAPDTLFLLRTDLQLSDSRLVPLEQFVLGGFGSVRGYPQNFRLTDNGVIASAEVRFPLFRDIKQQMLLQIIPFVDFGTGWNARGTVSSPSTLASVGLGFLWQWSDDLNVRIDWGIPLTEVDTERNSLQESGVYFSIIYRPF